ncbi:MAG TPA: BrnA antitoxin family protein [Acetobacteraceae bacterium]|nr:BrnA antitoxin family protein [Acetobacteraceae bacterium]
MARISGRPPARSKAKPGKSAAKRPARWVNLKVAWPQPKQAISLRIDQDILTWFRDGGPGYQTRMNAVLRAFVDSQQGKR